MHYHAKLLKDSPDWYCYCVVVVVVVVVGGGYGDGGVVGKDFAVDDVMVSVIVIFFAVLAIFLM